MANDGIRLTWWQTLVICFVLATGFSGVIYTASAQQSQKEDIVEIKETAEKRKDKVDAWFETVMKGQSETNVELAELVGLLKGMTN